jgi:uncharacterized membrane protein/PKD repeat protein/uncharacterized protein YegL
MIKKSWFYKVTAWAVTIGLLLQSFPFWLGMGALRPVTAAALNETNGATTTASPLTISRSQSSYASGDGLTVTYAIHNSLPPTQAPDVVPGQTLTDTLAALGNFDPLADPNTLRQVILVVEPTEATFVNASLPASFDNGVYTFHLDDIPPLGKATVTIELDGPGGVTEPTELDSGATGWGMVNGRAYHAAAPPAILWPDSMGDWLTCTVDANCQDEYVIAQAAELGQEPASLFAFVRDLDFESYSGSLRGARGTLWSEAGNSVDQASLLIALLRASGVPARYRSGELANPEIETLIMSMFPAPPGVVGYLPDDNPFPLADPLQNPALWSEIQDHYWVEAYLPGLGWTDLDPSFAAAEIGDRFVNEPDPAALSELPANVRHSVNLRVKVEKYHPLSGLTHSYPLDYSFSAVELVGEPVTFGHMVQTQNQGGLIFANIFHTYTPYLMLADADALLEGEPFQEIITNFPLGTSIVTGEWLEIELRHPDGTIEQHEREIYDAIGYDGRFNGGTINIGDSGRTDQPIVSELTLFTALFAPSFVPVEAIDAEYAEAATAVTEGQSAYERVNEIMADGQVGPDETDDLIAAAKLISRMTRASQRVLLMQHAAAADFGTRRLGDAFLMRPYYDAPRVHLMAWETNTISGQQTVNLDLRRNKIRALSYPGQSLRGWQAFNVSYGLAAMSLESDLLQRFSPDAPVKSVANILTAAQEQDIPLVTITAANLSELADLTISDEAKARITVDLFYNPNHFVIVPAAPVTLGDAETVGWLRSDILSGETIDVSEEGLHLVAVEYSILLNGSIQEIGFAIAGFGQGFAGFTLVFLGEFLAGIPGDMKAAWDAALAAATLWAEETAALIAENMEHDWVEAFLNGAGLHGGGEVSGPGGLSFPFGEFDWRIGGFNNGAAMAASVIGEADPPLPPALAARLPEHQFYRPAVGVMEVMGSGGTAVNATLNLDSLNVQGTLTAAWENSAQSGLRFQQLNGQGELLVNGNSVGAGSLVAHNGYMETSGAIAYHSAGTGGMGFYAPAVSGLGSGAFWGDTAVTLTPDTTAQLTLRGATAVLNGQVYTGTMSLVTTNPVALQASGPAAAPHFAAAASLTASGATLGLPPTAANITIGGTAVSLQNGLALPNFNGTIGVTEANATQDQVALNGDAHYFQLALDPPVATTPGATAAFQAAITANFSDSYTVTLSAPGWAASVAPDGGLTVTPPLTAAPGDYTVIATAQSHLYPTAVAAAEQVVTVEPIQGVDVTIQPDPIYTIPWGEPDGPEGATNNGQVQIPNAAYTVEIVNRSSQPHTFDVNVSGLNPDWLIFAGAEGQTTTQVTLLAGATTWIGLYVRPDTAVLPAPGTSLPFTVTAVAQADPDVNDSDNATFVMAAVPFQRLWLTPNDIYVSGQSAVPFDIHLRNIGNAAGSFGLTADLPAGWGLDDLQTPVSAAAGATASQTVLLNVPGNQASRTYRLNIASPVPGQVYVQTAILNVHVVGEAAAPIYNAAAGCLADQQPLLAAALHALALSVDALSASCAAGDCSLALRDQAANAAMNAVNIAYQAFPPLPGVEILELTASQLSTADDNAAIEAVLLDMSAAVTGMEAELCALLAYQPTLQFTPWLAAALPGQTAVYDLALTNSGSLTTSYAVTVTLPSGALTFAETLPPGATLTTTVPVSATQLGLHTIQAAAAAQEMDNDLPPVTAVAETYLNVVNNFVQVTTVMADPPFVETGVSTATLTAEIANVAGLRQPVMAEAAVTAPSGLVRWSDQFPLTILTGSPRLYPLGTVETSGWSQGIYTITLNLRDGDGAAVPGGQGHGYLIVGQGLQLSHSVAPQLVPPGTVTVTAVITTEVLRQQPEANSQQWTVGGRSSDLSQYPEATDNDEPGLDETLEETAVLTEEYDVDDEPLTDEMLAVDYGLAEDEPVGASEETAEGSIGADTIDDSGELIAAETPANAALMSASFTRYEQDAWTLNGSWTTVNQAWTSGGQIARSLTAGNSASITFEGTWAAVGFSTNTAAGHAEIFLNGVSQGIVDTYSRYNDVTAVYFDNLIDGTHTISVTVLGTSNPFASGQRVEIDYLDVWDGTPLPDGSFEENDGRVYLSGGWSTLSHATASGGQYIRSSGNVNAWFPFTGDSVTFQAFASNIGGLVKLHIDGELQGVFDLYNPTVTIREFSFDNLGPGAHVLQISSYRNWATVDRFVTPGDGPFYEPPVREGIVRYEEDDPALLYNGVSFGQTATSWNMGALAFMSSGYGAWSSTADDTVSLTFDGEWVSLGLATRSDTGLAEIFINGVSQGIVDTYSRYDDTLTLAYELTPGTHTISMTVLGQRGQFATNDWVRLDYIDVWDGAAVPEGGFEENDGRVYLSGGWSSINEATASGGQYIRSSVNVNAWFPFTGDSVTFQALAYNNGGLIKLSIDGEPQGVFDLYSATATTSAFSFDNLGPGAHVLQISSYRNWATVDRFVTPGDGPFYEPPVREGVVRYEEDDPALLYNGVPFEQTATSWNMGAITSASAGYGAWSLTADDTVSLTFDGQWVSLGFATRNSGGLAEIFINGVSQGIVDTYSRYDDTLSLAYELTPGTHTISMTVLGQRNDFSSANWVRLDYIDVWDGTPMPEGSFEENDGRLHLSGGWSTFNDAAASGGQYIRSSGVVNAWFPFTGDSVSFQALAYSNGGLVKLFIDGEPQGIFDLYSAAVTTRAFSFDNLGPGAHVLQVSGYRGMATVDRFVTPGEPPFYAPPVREGVVRYEEDDPALLYNGAPFGQTATSWNMGTIAWASAGYGAWSLTADDTVSLTFDGQWVSLGLATRASAGLAEIFINGVSQGIVDTYSRYDDTLTLAYDLTAGTHTISMTVLGQRNDFSSANWVRLDYIDVWDGTAVPDGQFEEDDERVYLAGGWTALTDANASDGRYIRSNNGHAWFHFEGDSFSYEAIAYSGGGKARLYVDGRYLDTVSLYNPTLITRTFSYEGFGSGAHALQVSAYRGNTTIDRFSSPGQAPFIDPTVHPPGVIRFEEDHPTILYNGAPFTRTATTWIREDSGFSARASDSQYIRSGAAGNTISFAFSGGWLGIGMVTNNVAGHAEIAVDGEVLEIVDLYTPGNGMLSRYYDNLGAGAHTLTITVLGTKHPDSGDTRVYLDFIDVWDGQTMPDGAVEEWDERIHYSAGWAAITEPAASDGRYVRSSGTTAYVNAWFPFTGDSVTYQALAYSGAGLVDIHIDGDYVGTYDLFNATPTPRAFSFGGLGAGPHVLQLEYNTGRVTLDRFDQPGEPPFLSHYEVDWIPITMFPTGRPGGTAVVAVGLRNQGIRPDSYDLIISGNEWAATIVSTAELEPTEIRPLEISVSVPPGTPLGASDTFTVTAVSHTDGSVTAQVSVTVYAGFVDAQLCIAMDGSGSISAAEFQLMVGGLAAAMRDDTAVPRNTTIEFSIIQFAGSTRTEIPPVVIVNEDAAEWVAQQIEQIGQINGGTPMQDAINLCADLLTNSPHTTYAQRQVINMVTDGEPNNAAATITARNNAIAAGVDQINAEAIGVTNAAIAFLRDQLVYPEPGYEAPPFIPGQGGFVIRADTFEEFVESIAQKVGFALDTGYIIELSHYAPTTAVNLITDTISPPPDAITGTVEAETLFWEYNQFAEQPARAHTLQLVLPDMQPGETRAVSLGTDVYYRLSGGENWLSLPPLYVTAERIIEIAPEEQAASVGGTAVYTLTLTNPGASDDLYSLTVLGLPGDWLNYPATVNVPAGGSAVVWLEVTAPINADPSAGSGQVLREWPFVVAVTTSGGGEDMAAAALTLFNGLEIAIAPPQQTAPTGTAVNYTLTVTNSEQSTVNSQLFVNGLPLVELPDEITIPGQTAVTIPITVTSVSHGPQPFSVTAVGDYGQATASALLLATGHYAVGLALDPESAVGGPGTAAEFSLTVTNLGDAPDGYDLALAVPAGWTAELDANGTLVNSLTLPAYLFNSADLRLRVTPDLTAVPGDYDFSVTAVSHTRPGVQATITGTVEVLPLGVTISIDPAQRSMSPLDTAVWQVTITNTGSVADSYNLAAAGVVGLTAEFSADSVTLAPGQSQTIQMSAGPMPLALPQEYLFWVTAVSQADERIANEAEAAITFTGYEGVEIAWLPVSQTVTDTLSANFLLVITNTGNIPTTYDLALQTPGLTSLFGTPEITLPAGATAVLPLTVWAGGAGVYTLTAVAQSSAANDSAQAELIIIIEEQNQPPLVNAGPDQTAVVNSLVQFNGSASDPDGDPLTFVWDFGDDNGATGTLTPTHVYEAIGFYTVTLTVSDSFGHVVSDTLQLTVVAEEIFAVDVGSDVEGDEGSPLTFNGVMTDTGGYTPYVIEWDFGDGATAAGSLTAVHTYADNGVYTVTLTVTNSENQTVSDSLVVTVHNVAPTVTAVDDLTVIANNELAAVLATFTDPGWLDTHTAVIDWGDGTVTAGTVDPTAQTVSGIHTYTELGVYAVTITVTDNDGGVGQATLQILVEPESYRLYLPIVVNN